LSHRIPAAPILPHLTKYLTEKNPTDEPGFRAYGPESQVLARKIGLVPDSFAKVLIGRIQTFDVDVADRLLCAMDMNELWRFDPELYNAYWEGEPPEDPSRPIKCAFEECDNSFPLASDTGANRRYCSRRCVERASDRRLGKHQPRHLRCRHGHPRSDEDQILPTGQRRCRECLRIANRRNKAAARARRRELADVLA
jgi:hypothetical protein